MKNLLRLAMFLVVLQIDISLWLPGREVHASGKGVIYRPVVMETEVAVDPPRALTPEEWRLRMETAGQPKPEDEPTLVNPIITFVIFGGLLVGLAYHWRERVQ